MNFSSLSIKNPIPAIMLFALLSLGAWFALRARFGRNEGQVKIWHKDVNDN